MEYGLLGSFRLLRPDGQERPTTQRQRDLLALLALHAGETVSRDRLIDALWGDDLPADPANALQQRVFHVRRLLQTRDGVQRLETTGTGYRLLEEPGAVDALRFEHLRTVAQRSRVAGDLPGTSRALVEALGLWRGTALQDIGGVWAVAAAERLDELRLVTLEDRIEVELQLGQHRAVVAELEELVRLHPLREQLHGHLMRALTFSGREADALEVYSDLRSVLAEELGLDPSPALQRLHEDILGHRLAPPDHHAPPPIGRDGSAVDQVEAPTGAARWAVAPAPTSSFIGREDELERLGTLLAADRIVTVTGPGGAGKTRLVAELLRSTHLPAGDDAADVVFVELGRISDPAAVPAATATAAGIRSRAGSSPVDLLHAAFGDQPVHLVLDNCEHLLDAACELVVALAAPCPRLRVLATSREPLGVDGEVVWPLDTLSLPAAGSCDLEAIADVPASRLFLDRVHSAAPDVRITEDDVPAIVRIVRELDGLPLAIELAASRARAMSLSEIADRLTDRFALLVGGRRDSPTRHQALTTTLEWSWDLLTTAQQRAWMAASVPQSSFTAEFLAPLLAAIDPDQDVIAAIGDLRDRSLLRVYERGTPTRYDMLTSIRGFGIQRLVERGAEAAVRDAHATAVERAMRAADRMDTRRWDLDLDAQRDLLPDVRAAIRWRLEQGDRHGAQRVAATLGWLAYLTALTSEGRRLLDATLGPIDDVDPEQVAYEAAIWAAGLRIGDADEEGLAWAELAVRLTDGVDDEVARGLALGFLASFRVVCGDIPGGLELMQQQAADATGWLEGMWRLLESKVLVLQGDLDRAQPSVERAIDAFEHAGAASSMLAGDVLVHLAQLRGDAETARQAAQRAIDRCIDHESWELELEVRSLLAMIEAATGDDDRSRQQLDRAATLISRTGLTMAGAMLAHAEGYVRFMGGEFDAARDAWERGLELHDWTGLIHGRPFALWGLGHVALAEGRTADAQTLLRTSFEQATARGDRDAMASALEGVAAVRLAEADGAAAARLLGAAESLRISMGAPAPLLSHRFADRTREQVREHLDTAPFEAAYRAGKELRTEELETLVDG